jgi:pimeloyl-ACP methyl ester carboxylesterase
MHSNGHSWREFSDVIPQLAGRFHVHVWDMPGQGSSDGIHPRTAVGGYAEVLREVLDSLDVERAVLVGCSIGAFIATEFANRWPSRASAVVLVEFAFRDAAWWQAAWPGVCDLFAVATQTREQIAARLHRDLDDELVERWNRDRNMAGVRQLLGVMWAIRQYDMATSISSLQPPVMVIFGGCGPTLECRPALERMLSPEARIDVVAGAGHFVSIDAPEAFVASLERFVSAAGI